MAAQQLKEVPRREKSAIIYSLLESIHMLDINLHKYLRDVLMQPPTMTNQTARQFKPAKWKGYRIAKVD